MKGFVLKGSEGVRVPIKNVNSNTKIVQVKRNKGMPPLKGTLPEKV